MMSAMASQIISITSVYSTVYPGADQRKHQSSASLTFVMGIHRWPSISPHIGPVTWKMLPFDDVFMILVGLNGTHDDVIKCKHFPSYWPFVRGIHRLLQVIRIFLSWPICIQHQRTVICAEVNLLHHIFKCHVEFDTDAGLVLEC